MLENAVSLKLTEEKIIELLGKRSIRDVIFVLNGLDRLAENGINELYNTGKFKWRLIKQF